MAVAHVEYHVGTTVFHRNAFVSAPSQVMVVRLTCDRTGTLDFTAQIWGGAPTLELSLDRSTGQNGDKLHLSITATKAGYYGGSQFQLTSSLGGQTTSWIGYVGN